MSREARASSHDCAEVERTSLRSHRTPLQISAFPQGTNAASQVRIEGQRKKIAKKGKEEEKMGSGSNVFSKDCVEDQSIFKLLR